MIKLESYFGIKTGSTPVVGTTHSEYNSNNKYTFTIMSNELKKRNVPEEKLKEHIALSRRRM